MSDAPQDQTGSREDPLGSIRLDLYSGEQLYRQLHQALRAAILSGAYSEGGILPSENELRDRLSIARTTVRNAMALLERDGLVRKERGRGTIVTHRPVTHSVWNFGSFSDLARSKGLRPVTRVLGHRIEDGTLILTRARGLDDGSRVTWMNLDTSWLPLALYPGIERYDFAALSLYEVLRRDYDRHPARSELSLRVVPPSALLSEVFGEDPAIAGYLCASGEVLDAEGHEVERTSIVYSPRVEMNFSTRWGQNPAPQGIGEK